MVLRLPPLPPLPGESACRKPQPHLDTAYRPEGEDISVPAFPPVPHPLTGSDPRAASSCISVWFAFLSPPGLCSNVTLFVRDFSDHPI